MGVNFIRLSVVIDDLNPFRASLGPAKDDPPLVIDPDRVVAAQITFERFQPIAERHYEIAQPHCGIELDQLAPRSSTEIGGKPLRRSPFPENGLGELSLETQDHCAIQSR